MGSSANFVTTVVVWTVSCILGLTMALLAVGLLGLWVAVGAFVGLGTTVVCGWLGQIAFATDFDAMLAEKARESGSADG